MKTYSKRQISRRIKKYGTLVCPMCGHTKSYMIYHHTEYPEVWNEERCDNCGFLKAFEDNSPWITWQEFVGNTKSMNKIYKCLTNW